MYIKCYKVIHRTLTLRVCWLGLDCVLVGGVTELECSRMCMRRDRDRANIFPQWSHLQELSVSCMKIKKCEVITRHRSKHFRSLQHSVPGALGVDSSLNFFRPPMRPPSSKIFMIMFKHKIGQIDMGNLNKH